jgi:phosphoglycerate dehydrogenase-like enzyme
VKILVTMGAGPLRDSFIPPKQAADLEALGEVLWNPLPRPYTGEELAPRLKGIDVLVTGWGSPQLNGTTLREADRLKVIAHTGGSVAAMVSPELYRRGIRVLSGNELYAESVAEAVIAYALTALRDIPGYLQTREQGWPAPNSYNEGLLDQPVGLLGFGAIARHVVRLLRPFRCPVKVWAGHLSPQEAEQWGVVKAGPEEIFSTCKLVSVHLAQRPETYRLVNEGLLARLAPGAVFINTARGSIVDEEALARLLAQGRFKAVLDVYQQEPLPMDSPLRGLPGVYLMPHMGGPTVDRRPYVTQRLIEALPGVLAGEASLLEIPWEVAARMTLE